jgi:hypothetical protein
MAKKEEINRITEIIPPYNLCAVLINEEIVQMSVSYSQHIASHTPHSETSREFIPTR